MPTIQQLPAAVQVNPTDEVMLDQSGSTVSATVAQVLAATAPTITLTGDVTGAGSSTIVTTLAPVATPGSYTKVSVNAKGQVTGGGAVASADVIDALGFTPYNAANPAGYVQASALSLGSMAAQSAGAVAITGGSVAGADVSAATVLTPGATAARSLAARAGEVYDVLDFGADPTGATDCSAAFAAAMNAVPNGAFGRIVVPPGTYKLGSFLNQPSGRNIAFDFQDGAITTGAGGLGVARVESSQGSFSSWVNGGGWFGFDPTLGSPQNLAFRSEIIENTAGNSGATRVAWNRNYANYNYYGKYVTGIDIAEQNIFTWPHLYDNSSGWGHWEVINGTSFDEDSAVRAGIDASAEHSEFDVVNNGPQAGWTFRAGQGLSVQGMSIDPWGQNGLYGADLLFAYGSVGSFDGHSGGLNQRWPSYPAVFSGGNPGAVPTNSTITIAFNATASATATLAGTGVGAVSVTGGGGIYTSAPTVAFSGGGGSGAAGTAVMLGGAVVGVTVTAPGSGYLTAPSVSFTGGGVAAPTTTTVTLNPDGAHGDLFSVAAAINAANIPFVRAAVAQWGGVVDRLVVFGTAADDLGTLTLGGSALATLGIAAQAYSTPRDTSAVVFGGTGSCLPTDLLTLNGTVVRVGGAGAMSDVVNAINTANIVGIKADTNAGGRLVLTCWIPQNPGGLVISQPSGYSTLAKLGLNAGTYWPPTPPKGFASAYGELSAPVCLTTDKLSIAATDLAGNSYGPVTVQLNGGAGTGWIADVVTSIETALTAAGFYSATWTMLTAPPAVVAVQQRNSGGNQGIMLRNTAGGTLTLANVNGTPLQTLGLVAGTYQPGGGSAGSQSVFMAAEDSIAAQGRGVFVGGASNATDPTVLPHAPLEARGSFLHGLRTDKATFQDNNALLLGAGQAIGFGSAVSLTASGSALAVNGAAVALASAVPTHVSQLTNDAGYLAAVPVASTTALGGVKSDGASVTISPAGVLTAIGAVSSVAGRTGAVTLGIADVSGFSAGAAAAAPVQSVAGRTGAVTLGTADIANFALGAAAAAPVQSVNGRTGAVTLGSADVTGALGYTPLSNAGGTLSGALTLGAGGTLDGTLTNAGTISGGTHAGPFTMTGTISGTPTFSGAVAFSAAATGTTASAGDNSTKLATTAYVYQATSAATTIATTGGSTTLTAAQYATPIILVSGTLTSAATLVMPNSGVWTINNATTGAFTLTVKTAGGSGVTIDQGYSAEVYANGTNVVLSTTDFNGITLQGTVTNAGTISGGALAGSIANSSTLSGAVISGTLTVGTGSTDTLGIYATNGVYFVNNVDTADAHFYFQNPNGKLFVVDNVDATTLANYVQVRARSTGNDPIVLAAGSDTNINLSLQTKGTGVIKAANALQINAGGTIAAATTLVNSGIISGGTVSPATLVAGNAGSMLTVSQLTDAGGYHPMVLANSGTNTNVPMVLAPTGSGYVAAALADGTTANGNQRGQYAVDWQQSRSANTQVASGAYATVAGGAGNTAAGNYSFAAGQGGAASGQGSVALGQYANDGGAYGKLVFSANAGAVGNQFAVSTLYVSSVSAATRMTSDGAAAGAANSLPIRSNHVIAGTLTVAARNVSTGDGAFWSIPVLFKNSAGTVSVTSPGTAGIAPTAADSSLSSASIAIAADNTNKGLSVTITPPSSVTVNASAVFLAAEM